MLDALAKSRHPARPWPAPVPAPVARAHGPHQPLHEALDLAFRLGAHEAVHRLPLVEGEHGRNRLDAQLLRDLRILVDVDLDQRHLAAGVSHRLLQNRRELLAGAAPGRPEIDDHRRLLRRLDHVGGEALGRRVLRLRRAAGRLANEGIHTRMLPAGEDSIGQNVHGSLHRALQACPRAGTELRFELCPLLRLRFGCYSVGVTRRSVSSRASGLLQGVRGDPRDPWPCCLQICGRAAPPLELAERPAALDATYWIEAPSKDAASRHGLGPCGCRATRFRRLDDNGLRPVSGSAAGRRIGAAQP